MGTFSVNVIQSYATLSVNLSASQVTTFAVTNSIGSYSYFTLETARNANGFYDSSSPRNLTGSFTLGSGISNLIQSDYIASVVVAPGGGQFTFTPSLPVTGSSLYLRGVSSPVPVSGGTDADAQAFITAAGITDATQQSAINTLVTDLKGYGIWSKMKALYPFVGGTASAHKFNLKDPRDLDAAFRLVFSGGWTHSLTGALPNGTNAYADSKLNPTYNLSANSVSFGVYSRTNATPGNYAYGVFQASSNIFQQNLGGGNFNIGDFAIGFVSYTANPSTKMMIGTRRAINDLQAYRDGISLGTDTNSSGTNVNGNFYFGARNRLDFTSQDFYSIHQLAFAFIGDALTNQNCLDLTSAVNNYQTTLSRNI